VNHLLGNTLGLKILVVENEVGQEGIDHELLLQQTKKEQIILMNNGCVCCSVRGDLIQTFKQLFKSDSFSLLNWVVIETTGLADPGPVIQTLFMDDDCKKHMRLDACITVVDSKHIVQHFGMYCIVVLMYSNVLRLICLNIATNICCVLLHSASAAAGGEGAHKGLAVPEAVQQLAFADRILLNKIDLVTEAELVNVTEQVH
jgi:G3E family GTPase